MAPTIKKAHANVERADDDELVEYLDILNTMCFVKLFNNDKL